LDLRWQWLFATIKTVCVCLLTAGALWLMWDAHLALRGVQLGYLVGNLESASKDVPRAISDAAGGIQTVTSNLGGVIQAERDAQKEQLQEAQKLMAATKEVLVRTNCQLNGGPGCRGLLPQATTTLEGSAQQIQLLAKSGQDTLQSASFLLNSANRRIQDQRIDDVLAHFDESSLHLDLATASGASILAHGDHVAAYWDKKVTTPPRLIKTLTIDALHLITIPLR
jgi:hypothetical protein